MTAIEEAVPSRLALRPPPPPLGWCSDCIGRFCAHDRCPRYVQAVTMRDGTGLCVSCHGRTDRRRIGRPRT